MKFITAFLLLVNLSALAQKSENQGLTHQKKTERYLRKSRASDAGKGNEGEKYSRALQRQVDSLFVGRKNIHYPGAVIAVIKNGKIEYKKGYGYANLEYDIPNTPSTVFHIASISKQFTALSILLLAKEGKLSLNDNINKYIPEMPVFAKPITILNLLNHTSGLREWIYLLGIQGYRLNDMFTQEQIVKVLSDQKELNPDPGSKFMYVNSGYNLLAEIVARVSGMPFSRFVNQQIFIPLKMAHSRVVDDYETVIKNQADSYGPVGENVYKKRTLSFVNVIGSTGILTTVEDLSKWVENFDYPKVGDIGIFDQMKQRGVLTNGDTINYAMGQFIGNYRGQSVIEHSGSDAGFRTHLLRFPKQGVSVIVLANDASLNAGDIAYKIADIYLKKELKAAPPIAANLSPSASPGAIKSDPQTLIKYAGKYELRPGMIMDFMVEGNDLTVNATGQGKFKLQQISPTVFKINNVNGIISFKKNEQNEMDKIDFEINGGKMHGTRIKEKGFTEESAEQYTGQYYSRELDVTYSLVYNKGKLIAKHYRSDNNELSQIDNDSFSGNQWFMGIVKFIRNDKQAITGFFVSSDRISNLRFEKK